MLRRAMIAVLLVLVGPPAMAAPFDEVFMRHEAQASSYELAFARLGQVRATRSDVRTYASILVNDHEAYNGALRDLAASKGMAVPPGLAARDKTHLDRLERTRGAAFDRAFVKEAQRINSEALRTLRQEAARTADPDIHSFVDRFLEVDTKHEAAARALSEHTVASKGGAIHPPPTGDKMVIVPPPSGSSVPESAPPVSVSK